MINAISNYLNGLNNSSPIKNVYLVIVAMTDGTLKTAIKNLPNNSFRSNFELGVVFSGLTFLMLMIEYQVFMFFGNINDTFFVRYSPLIYPFIILSLATIFTISLMILKLEKNNFVGE